MNELQGMMHGIYGWTAKDGQPVPPTYKFPKCVQERINWVRDYEDDCGLGIMGMMSYVFATTGSEQDFNEVVGEGWLPVSDEFVKWRDTAGWQFKEMLVAVALLYGIDGE